MTKDERLCCLDHCTRYAEIELDKAKRLTKKKPIDALHCIADAMMALQTAEHHYSMLERKG